MMMMIVIVILIIIIIKMTKERGKIRFLAFVESCGRKREM